MSKQYHYIVMYDTETEKYSIEVEGIYITPGNVWDTKTEKWSDYADEESVQDDFIAREDALGALLHEAQQNGDLA